MYSGGRADFGTPGKDRHAGFSGETAVAPLRGFFGGEAGTGAAAAGRFFAFGKASRTLRTTWKDEEHAHVQNFTFSGGDMIPKTRSSDRGHVLPSVFKRTCHLCPEYVKIH